MLQCNAMNLHRVYWELSSQIRGRIHSPNIVSHRHDFHTNLKLWHESARIDNVGVDFFPPHENPFSEICAAVCPGTIVVVAALPPSIKDCARRVIIRKRVFHVTRFSGMYTSERYVPRVGDCVCSCCVYWISCVIIMWREIYGPFVGMLGRRSDAVL